MILNAAKLPMPHCKKRHVMLLEVLIAFALVALCVLPLIYPQVFILKSERKFLETIELDHAVNLLYGAMLEKLYRNEIRWADIVEEARLPITDSMIEELHLETELPFNGDYQFFIAKRKPPPPEDRLYLVHLIFSFSPKKVSKKSSPLPFPGSDEPKKKSYCYQIFIERREKQQTQEKVEEESVKEGTP